MIDDDRRFLPTAAAGVWPLLIIVAIDDPNRSHLSRGGAC